MSNMILFAPLTPSTISVSGGDGDENLLLPSPKDIYVATLTTAININLDFGEEVEWDSVFVGFTNAVEGCDWLISGGSVYNEVDYLESTPFRAHSTRTNPRQHGFHRLAGTVSSRYLRIQLTQGTSPPLQIGVVAVGKAFEPEWNREWGSGRIPVDTGTAERQIDGGFGIDQGVVKWGYQWRFGDLTDDDLDELSDHIDRVGETSPLVVVEEPTINEGLNERIHYGLFNRLDKYERQAPGQTRWGLSIEQWV